MMEVEKLEAQLKVLEARKQQILAREKTKQRKINTRKKALVGAAMMDAVKDGEINWQIIETELDKRLKRENDRQLFGLGPKCEAEPYSAEPFPELTFTRFCREWLQGYLLKLKRGWASVQKHIRNGAA